MVFQRYFGCQFSSNGNGLALALSERGKVSPIQLNLSDKPHVVIASGEVADVSADKNSSATPATARSRFAVSAESFQSMTSSSVTDTVSPIDLS